MTREGTLEAVAQCKRELDAWASSESEGGQGSLPVVLFANKSDLLTNAKVCGCYQRLLIRGLMPPTRAK